MISSISQMVSKCEKCRYKNICNNKKMGACAMAKTPKSNVKVITNNNVTKEIQENIMHTIAKATGLQSFNYPYNTDSSQK